jgi:hypothetical protein
MANLAPDEGKASQVQGSKGKGKGKGKDKGKQGDNEKCEVHVLGGESMQEMLFVEAWGAAASAFYNLAVPQSLIQIEKPRIVSQRPK